MKFNLTEDLKDNLLIGVVVAIVVFVMTGGLLWMVFHKETCSLCNQKVCFENVSRFTGENNVGFWMCNKCAWEAFREKIQK